MLHAAFRTAFIRLIRSLERMMAQASWRGNTTPVATHPYRPWRGERFRPVVDNKPDG
jgi:hypothetical protein